MYAAQRHHHDDEGELSESPRDPVEAPDNHPVQSDLLLGVMA
jgi:hypothetical protein